MDDKLQFDLVSPERLVISERVDSVTIPGVEGDFGVLPNHSPVMAMIREGELIVESDGAQRRFALAGGFADVTPEGVTVLAEAISTPDTADAN
jgi:F-type H+-transporting ATPase subunit epsilon